MRKQFTFFSPWNLNYYCVFSFQWYVFSVHLSWLVFPPLSIATSYPLLPSFFSFTPSSVLPFPSFTVTYAINRLYMCISFSHLLLPPRSTYHSVSLSLPHPWLSTPPSLLYYPLIPILLCLCSSVTAVRLPDSLSFVVYEFWDGQEEWKRWVFNRLWVYLLKNNNISVLSLSSPWLISVTHDSIKSFLIFCDLCEQASKKALMQWE